jgi:bacteriocin-like protein
VEKQFEGKTHDPQESKVEAEDTLTDQELDEISGGDDESPKEEHRFGHF